MNLTWLQSVELYFSVGMLLILFCLRSQWGDLARQQAEDPLPAWGAYTAMVLIVTVWPVVLARAVWRAALGKQSEGDWG